MNLTPKQIEADKKLCEAATPGPWYQEIDGFAVHCPRGAEYGCQAVEFEGYDERRQEDAQDNPYWPHVVTFANSAFIARARAALPQYIAALAEKDAKIGALEARLASATKALGDITLDRIPDAVKESLARGNLNYCVTAKDIARAALKEIGGE